MTLSRFFARFLWLLLIGITFNLHAANPITTIGDWSDALRDRTNGRVNLSGYINAHYMKHEDMPVFVNRDPNEVLLQIREASIFADISVTDNVLFSTELEASYDFSDKNASGRDERFKGVLNYYYFDFDVGTMRDWDLDGMGSLNVRIGRFLVPFLQYNENKPNFKQSLMSQPFTAWQVVPSNNAAIDFEQYGWSDFGFMFDWSKEFGPGIFNIKGSIINGLGVDGDVLDTSEVTLNSTMMMAMDDGMGMGMGMGMMAVNPTVRVRDGLHNARSEWDDISDSNSDVAYSAKISFAPYAMPLNIGVSWYSGAWDKDADHSLTMTGIHVDFIKPRGHIKGEIVRADIEQTAGINEVEAMGPSGVNTSTGDYTMSASYVEGAYKVWQYGAQKERYVKMVLRFDKVNTNDEASFTPFHRTRQTYGVEWQFLHNIRLRAEHQRHTLEDFDNAPPPFSAAGGGEEITMNMISIIANF